MFYAILALVIVGFVVLVGWEQLFAGKPQIYPSLMETAERTRRRGNWWSKRQDLSAGYPRIVSLILAFIFCMTNCWAKPKALSLPARNTILVPPGTRLRIAVHATGQTLSEVLAAVNQQSSWRLTAAPSLQNERVIIEFVGTVPEFMQGVARLLHYGWTPPKGPNPHNAYLLQALPKTLEIEKRLRHLPYLEGIATLRAQTARELEALKDNPDADYLGAGEAWGKQFLTLLSPDQVAGLFEHDYIMGTPGDLTPLQAEALWNFVRSTLAANSFDKHDKVLLAALTADKFRALPLVINAVPEHYGGRLMVHVPDMCSVSVTLHAKKRYLPQGTDPFEDMPLRSPPPIKTHSQTVIAVALPANWRSAIAALQGALHKNIFSDCYLEQTPFSGPTRQPVSHMQAPGWEALLDQVCSQREKQWWGDDKTIFVRDSRWYLAKIKEPAPSVVQALTADIRNGQLRNSTLLSLADLPRLQLLTLLQALWDAEFDFSETILADFLTIYRAGGARERALILSDGLALDRFDGVQLSALEKLAPDGLRRGAGGIMSGSDTSELLLRLMQTGGDKADADIGIAVLQLRLYSLRDVATQLRLVVLKQEEPIPPLLVTQVTE